SLGSAPALIEVDRNDSGPTTTQGRGQPMPTRRDTIVSACLQSPTGGTRVARQTKRFGMSRWQGHGCGAESIDFRAFRGIRAVFLVGVGLLATLAWIAILGWLLYRAILTVQ